MTKTLRSRCLRPVFPGGAPRPFGRGCMKVAMSGARVFVTEVVVALASRFFCSGSRAEAIACGKPLWLAQCRHAPSFCPNAKATLAACSVARRGIAAISSVASASWASCALCLVAQCSTGCSSLARQHSWPSATAKGCAVASCTQRAAASTLPHPPVKSASSRMPM